MEALGRAAGCYNNPDDAPGFGKEGPYLFGCAEFSGRAGTLVLHYPDGRQSINAYVWSVGEPYWEKEPDYQNGPIGTYLKIDVIEEDYSALTLRYSKETIDAGAYLRTSPRNGSTCTKPIDETPKYPDWQPDTPIGPAYEYYDPETGCTWSIAAMDSYLNSAGEPVFHWRAVSDDPVKCGDAYEWWGNGQEPNIPNFPDPTGPYGRPHPPTLPPGPGQDVKDKLDDILERLDELEKCACPEKPELAKHWRSIRFDSDETTARGNRRLSKLFRYRGISPGVVDAVADHWKDFRWTTGPVCVYPKGSALGTPQVWASTPDEGKRVIRHAGREAGVDPDQTGEWGVSGSDNPRYGVSLEVGLFCVDGCWSATSRPGPNGYPEADQVWPDP